MQRQFGPDSQVQNDMLVRCRPIMRQTDQTDTQTQGSFIRHGLNQKQCETEALFQLAAGSDTTATAIRATLLYVMTTPAVYRALQTMIDAGIKTGTISSPIKNAEAMELPYLQVRPSPFT